MVIKIYNEYLSLIDWFCTYPGKLPQGYNSRVNVYLPLASEFYECFQRTRHSENFFTCRQSTNKVQKIVKIFVPQFCSWDGSFRHGEMKIWLCLYFQHVTRYIGTDFVEESRRQIQRSEEEHFFRKGYFDRKEDISSTANKRCSRQVLQL